MTARECTVHRVHHPSVAVVHDLHVFPEELQQDVWGEVRDHETVLICGTGRDSVHLCVNYMLAVGPPPDNKIGRDTWDLAQEAVKRYELARHGRG